MKHAIAIALLFLSAPAWAQQTAAPAAAASGTKPPNNSMQNLGLGKHDSNAPIHLSADNFSSDVKQNNGDYVGNVIATQGDMKMRADRMHFDTAKGDLSLIISTGHVVVDAPRGTGTGDKGVYDLNTHLITLTGRVVLTKQKNVMRGTKLVMDMTTNLAHLTADSSQGGRVQALFIPKPRAGADTGAKSGGASDKPAGTPPQPPDSTEK